jgi:hypothetical protein
MRTVNRPSPDDGKQVRASPPRFGIEHGLLDPPTFRSRSSLRIARRNKKRHEGPALLRDDIAR